MPTPLNFVGEITKGSLIGGRVRLKTGEVGTLVNHNGLACMVRGKPIKVTLADIAECGDDIKFRCRLTCKKHGIVFVTMSSLCRR